MLSEPSPLTNRSPTPTVASQLGSMVTLFVILRLTILILYTPRGLLNYYTDYMYYYQVAQLSEQGHYPYLNMWFEYPPLLAYLPIGAYQVMRTVLSPGDVGSVSYHFYTWVLGMILLVFETGVLILLYRIAERIWGTERANWSGWVYSTLSLPLFYWNFSHQNVAVFFTMLSIYWFIEGRRNASALALGLGGAAKLVPLFLLAPVARFLWPRLRSIIGFSLSALAVTAASYMPFVLLGKGEWVFASLTATSKVGSYDTVWALLDGNWGPGNYGPLATRLQIEQASITHANPSLVSPLLSLAIFIIIYGLLFFRPLNQEDPRHFVWFVALSAMIFHLWLRGWSPQYGMLIIPLLLLSFPDRLGLILSLTLTGLAFLSWMIGALPGTHAIVALLILGRSAVFIVVGVLLVRRLWPPQQRIAA